ncbi:MAG TPA: hypothetical protein VNM72_04820 [Blastocatellia bacterium]|nr:hypothetical protein [Blastocatellia bacterium]
MRNRFEENGIVICESSDTGSCNGAVAWASPFTKKVHLCPSLFRNVDAISRKPDRRACYAAILTHEFAHSCDRFEPGADRLDEAAFDWYASTHDLTITKTACGFN